MVSLFILLTVSFYCRKGYPLQELRVGSCLTLSNELPEETQVAERARDFIGKGCLGCVLSHAGAVALLSPLPSGHVVGGEEVSPEDKSVSTEYG